MKSKKLAKRNSNCRYCKSTHLTRFLSLGNQPPSNSFISPEHISEEVSYPLEVYICEACYLVQLIDVVPKEIIFNDYIYLSSSSKALTKHYANLAQLLTKQFDLKSGDMVVDIGCNDGVLLRGYTKSGLIRIGVEPSNVAEIAKAEGFDVFKDFFDLKTVEKIVKKYGRAKIVTATNVFAHVDDIASFVKGLPLLIEDNGLFVIEVPYLIDLIDQTLFDTIYHEHLCYLSVSPMASCLQKFGLEIFDVKRIPFGASGPAIRVFVQKIHGKQPIKGSVKDILVFEKNWGIDNKKKYTNFAKKVEKVKSDLLRLIKQNKASGAQIGAYSAPAKGNTLLNYFGLTADSISYIAETNFFKQGLLTPGSHIPIISEKQFLTKMPDYALLLSWNYLDFFLGKSKYIKKGGKFIVPLPKPRIVP